MPNATFYSPANILRIAHECNDGYGDLQASALKELASTYSKAMGKLGSGVFATKEEAALFWDDVFKNKPEPSNPGFRAIKKSGSEILKNSLSESKKSKFLVPRASDSEAQLPPPSPVTSSNLQIVLDRNNKESRPSDTNARDTLSTKEDVIRIENSLGDILAAISKLTTTAQKVDEIDDRVKSLENKVESHGHSAARVDLIANRVTALESLSGAGADVRTKYQGYLADKAEYFDKTARRLEEGYLEVTIKNRSRYIRTEFDDDITINEESLFEDFNTPLRIVGKNKTLSGIWILLVKIDDNPNFRAGAHARWVLDNRTVFKGHLGVRLSVPEEIESFRYTWLHWKRAGVITCFDYSKNGTYLLYINDKKVDLQNASMKQLKDACATIRVFAPKHLAMMPDPTLEKILPLADDKNYFVYMGVVYKKPETLATTQQTASGRPKMPERPKNSNGFDWAMNADDDLDVGERLRNLKE